MPASIYREDEVFHSDEYDMGMIKKYFTHETTGTTHSVVPCSNTGWYQAVLPAGRYHMEHAGQKKRVTLLATRNYRIDAPLCDYSLSWRKTGGKVTVTLRTMGSGTAVFNCNPENLSGTAQKREIVLGKELVITADIVDSRKPYYMAILPNGNIYEALEVYGR